MGGTNYCYGIKIGKVQKKKKRRCEQHKLSLYTHAQIIAMVLNRKPVRGHKLSLDKIILKLMNGSDHLVNLTHSFQSKLYKISD